MAVFNVQDSVAFVTGTNKANGIGRAIVDALLEAGAKKVYATARDVRQLDLLVTAHAGKVVPVALDVTDLKSIKELGAKYSDVNLVVNNSGFYGDISSLGEISVAQSEIAVNYIAPMAIVKSFSTVFFDKTESEDDDVKTSAVVNINSIASFINFPLGGTYSASKAAEHSLTQAQRRDLAPSNTLVVGVYPGPIDTEMTKNVPFEKTPPSGVAQATVEALGDGTEDVFPDAFAAQLFDGWKEDAKAMERQMAESAAQDEEPN